MRSGLLTISLILPSLDRARALKPRAVSRRRTCALHMGHRVGGMMRSSQASRCSLAQALHGAL